ncbi:MAG: hypothetical protein IJX17_01445, partial [Clostridia bacterium]|nr:hypothetical protein [Clostridia bacterium]
MNVKKRIICNILCFMIVLCSMFTFTACDKDCKHKWGEWETVVESTCTTTGTKKRQCSKCEEFEEDSIAVIAHNFGSWVEEVLANCTVAGTKAHKDCSVCKKHFDNDGNEILDLTITIDENAHNYGVWTSNGDGTHSRQCLHNSEHVETVSCAGGEATCEEKAVCDTCKGEYGELKNHTFGAWNEEVPATCSKTGTKGYKDCSVCEKHFDKDGNKIVDLTLAINSEAHNYGAWTSNGDGTHTRVCSYNNAHLEKENCAGGKATCEEKAVCDICKKEYGNFGGHTFGEWINEKPATCSEVGTKGHKDCLVCEKHFDKDGNEIEDLTIAVNSEAHNYGAWTSNGDGTHTRVCSYNNAHLENGDCTGGEATCDKKAVCDTCKGEYGELKNHTFGDWNEEVPATCSKTGTKGYKDCSVCEKHFDNDGNEITDLTLELNAVAHNYGAWTSNGNGYHTRVCLYDNKHTELDVCSGGEATCEERAVCEICEEAYGNLADHTFGDWSEEVPATCSQTGTKAHKDCLVCEKHFDENDNEIEDLTIEIDEEAHNYGAWTSNGDNTHSRVCVYNGEHIETLDCTGGEA